GLTAAAPRCYCRITMTDQGITAASDPVDILSRTDVDDAKLVVWLGELDTPFGYWPNDDEDACREAVEEWVRRETSIFGYADDEDSDEQRVERYMSAITIEQKDHRDDDIERARAHLDATAYAGETVYGFALPDASE